MYLSIVFDRTFRKDDLKFRKDDLKSLIQWTFRRYGSNRTIKLSDRLKNLGFRLGLSSGISISIEDLLIPKEKRLIIQLTQKKMKKINRYKRSATITYLETNQVLISNWTITSESFKNSILEIFCEEDPLNPLYLMTFSGARRNWTQARQLIGVRGLIIDPLGRIVKVPIQSNFKSGITLIEFLFSCCGSRKGIVDTALRTSRAGYLTRRLVDIAHFQIISIRDCHTPFGIRIFLAYIYVRRKKEIEKFYLKR